MVVHIKMEEEDIPNDEALASANPTQIIKSEDDGNDTVVPPSPVRSNNNRLNNYDDNTQDGIQNDGDYVDGRQEEHTPSIAEAPPSPMVLSPIRSCGRSNNNSLKNNTDVQSPRTTTASETASMLRGDQPAPILPPSPVRSFHDAVAETTNSQRPSSTATKSNGGAANGSVVSSMRAVKEEEEEQNDDDEKTADETENSLQNDSVASTNKQTTTTQVNIKVEEEDNAANEAAVAGSSDDNSNTGEDEKEPKRGKKITNSNSPTMLNDHYGAIGETSTTMDQSMRSTTCRGVNIKREEEDNNDDELVVEVTENPHTNEVEDDESNSKEASKDKKSTQISNSDSSIKNSIKDVSSLPRPSKKRKVVDKTPDIELPSSKASSIKSEAKTKIATAIVKKSSSPSKSPAVAKKKGILKPSPPPPSSKACISKPRHAAPRNTVHPAADSSLNSNCWMKGLEHFLTHIPHGPRNKVSSPDNTKTVMRRVKQLASGKGIEYKHWKKNLRFNQGIFINIDTTNFDKLHGEAKLWEKKYGKDKGNGWLLQHPIKKLQLYQEYRRRFKMRKKKN